MNTTHSTHSCTYPTHTHIHTQALTHIHIHTHTHIHTSLRMGLGASTSTHVYKPTRLAPLFNAPICTQQVNVEIATSPRNRKGSEVQ